MPALPFERLILTGFMGSGKTTVGRLLAARLHWHFADLDEEISKRVGLSVPDIFSRLGEPHFRLEETAALTACLQRKSLVLALGGGAPESIQNRQGINATPLTAVVYLEGSFDVLQSRCLAQSGEPHTVARPVLSDSVIANQRFDRRVPAYLEIATLTVNTVNRTPETVAGEIEAILFPSETP